MAGARRIDASPDGVARRSAVESGSSPVRLRRLWLGLLLAPGVWVLGEILGYYLAARSCELSPGGVPLLGTAHPAVTHIVFEAIAAIIAALGFSIALTNWRESRYETSPGDAPAPGRAHFMAFTGLVVSALFLFGIVLFGVSGFVVNTCSQAR